MLFRSLFKLPIAFLSITFLWVLLLKWCPVVITPLMISRTIEFRKDTSFHTYKKWISYKNISPELSKAVIASEDDCILFVLAQHLHDVLQKVWGMRAWQPGGSSAGAQGMAAPEGVRHEAAGQCGPIAPGIAFWDCALVVVPTGAGS